MIETLCKMIRELPHHDKKYFLGKKKPIKKSYLMGKFLKVFPLKSRKGKITFA